MMPQLLLLQLLGLGKERKGKRKKKCTGELWAREHQSQKWKPKTLYPNILFCSTLPLPLCLPLPFSVYKKSEEEGLVVVNGLVHVMKVDIPHKSTA